MTAPISELLDQIAALTAITRLPALPPTAATARLADLASMYETLTDELGVSAYAPDPCTDERTEQVVVTLHGIDVSVHGDQNRHTVIVADRRDRPEQIAQPLTARLASAETITSRYRTGPPPPHPIAPLTAAPYVYVKDGQVACPRCETPGQVHEIRVLSNPGTFLVDGDRIVAVDWDEDEESAQRHYACEHCGAEVDLPDDVDEDWL